MSAHNTQDIIDYYDQAHFHFRYGWDLDKSMAIHYGFWRKDTRNFRQSLYHCNLELSLFGGIKKGQKILDAGCGVGGSSIFLAKEYQCKVTGISLSSKQVAVALENAAKYHDVTDLLDFQVMDYTRTTFPDESFDIIWALESLVHALDKEAFFKEANRILKPGGKIVIADLFQSRKDADPHEDELIRKMLHPVAIPGMIRISELENIINVNGMQNLEYRNVTPNIVLTAKRMYFGSFIFALLNKSYRFFHSGTGRFAANHHQYPYYQYLTLKRGLWNYYFVSCEKIQSARYSQLL